MLANSINGLLERNGACIATNLVKTSKNENGQEVIFFYFNSDQIDKAIEKVLVKEKCEHI